MRFTSLAAFICRVLPVLALSAGLCAQTTRLKAGRTVQDDLSEGQTHSYSIKLRANQYLRALVSQASAAVVVELYTPDGKKALEVETRPGRTARIVWVSAADGEYRISVGGAGHYEIKFEKLRAAGPDDRKRAEADRLLAQGRSEAGKYAFDQAILLYTRALELYREIKDREREADTLTAAGYAYDDSGQGEKAIGFYQQSLPIRREIRDRRGEGIALNNLGNSYLYVSQNEKAIGYYEQALAIRREIKDLDGEGRTLNNLGIAHSASGHYDKAIGYFDRALAVERDIKDRAGEGDTLGNLGTVYTYLSQYERAIEYFEQDLAIHREVKDSRGEGIALNNLGVAYQKLKDYQKAIVYYEQALPIRRAIKDRFGEGSTLGGLGDAHLDLRRYEEAIGYLEQAAVILHEVKAPPRECEVLAALGDTYRGLHQYEKASSYYSQALAISREVKDRYDEVKDLSGLMDTWQAVGRPRLAIFYGKQAVNTVQSIRSDNTGLSQDLQRSFLKGNEKPYHALAEILIAQGRLAEAEQVLALLKEEEYFQYIRRDAGEASSLNRRADLTPEESEYERRYREIGDRLMTIGVERGELLVIAKGKTLTPEQSQRLAKLEQDLAAGNQAFEHFLGELTQHFSVKPKITERIEALRESQGMMEDLREFPPGTVAIFTLIGDDKFYTILRTPDAQKSYEYPIKAADLTNKIFEFRQVLQDPKLDPRPLAQELYKILIAGMADDLHQAKAQTLMWSLDGALRYVPLAALYDGKLYLIEQYRVSVMTLASGMRLKDPPDLNWKAAGFGVTKGYEDASALPSVSSELTGIIKILGGEMKLDDQFTRQTMRDTLLKRYPVVHIASHFRFQPGNDTKSFLLLGDGGQLTLGELKTSANLFGGVQLLTLSACNTGVGDGAEVEGFGTLAQRQGAKSVIASLWPVADESTSRLMQEFYRIRESSPGMTKLEALRESQLALLRGEYQHPYYWAPFFLMGNWL